MAHEYEWYAFANEIFHKHDGSFIFPSNYVPYVYPERETTMARFALSPTPTEQKRHFVGVDLFNMDRLLFFIYSIKMDAKFRTHHFVLPISQAVSRLSSDRW